MEQTVSLYDLLGLSSEATQSQITKAYRLMALKVHPDKNPQDYENAQKNFQKLSQAYEILSDPYKRKVYDLTGELEDSDEYFEAYRYYREVYHQVTPEEIEDFARRYKDSEMEEEDLIQYYLASEGNMKDILYFIPLSEAQDLPRFWSIYERLIKEKKLPKKKNYSKTKNKIKLLKEDGENLAPQAKPKKAIGSGMEDLINKIKRKQEDSSDFLSYLENKYSKPKKSKKNK